MKELPFLILISLAARIALGAETGTPPDRKPGETVHLRDCGAAGDGKTDDTPVMHKALQMARLGSGTLLIPQGDYLIGALTIPDEITLQFGRGGRLIVKPGEKLTMDGTISAGITPIFEGEVAGRLKNPAVYPQWFGAKGDGNNDDTLALQRAANLAMNSASRTLLIPEGRYFWRGKLEIRCNVQCMGTLVKKIGLDPSKTKKSTMSHLTSYHPMTNACIEVKSDAPEIKLAPQSFYGIKENDFKVPNHENLPLENDPKKTATLETGGTLSFKSTDFFTSRNNNKGDEWYDKVDICQVVSTRGDIHPEFVFSYAPPSRTTPWNKDLLYKKGDYCESKGLIYKATWPSGPGAQYTHPSFGKVEIGPRSPENCEEENASRLYEYQYSNGARDSIVLWRKVHLSVSYTLPQRPIEINGLQVEISGPPPDGEYKRIENCGVLYVKRSNATFNRASIVSKDKFMMLNQICSVSDCCNTTFNDCIFSGATYHGLGYNITNYNCANLSYNRCISTNCRDGMAGRHGKNITIQGGQFNRIDDHYGRNYIIRDVDMHAVSTMVPGYCTPAADVRKWRFVPTMAFAFSGSNVRVENCRVYNCAGLLAGRGDGGFYGNIVIKDVVIQNQGDATVFSDYVDPKFDYIHTVPTPDRVILENIRINEPHRLTLGVTGFENLGYGPIEARHCGPIGQVFGRTQNFSFAHCRFKDTAFKCPADQGFLFQNCVFDGETKGITPIQMENGSGNRILKKDGAATNMGQTGGQTETSRPPAAAKGGPAEDGKK
ncbi:MAG: glycosyl hydrolase family 28-related protein [Verrucomicrobiae bacterium]|nr:glycosyl hydrolase family 28-related protein [Verrucomicrobiae bacterium]